MLNVSRISLQLSQNTHTGLQLKRCWQYASNGDASLTISAGINRGGFPMESIARKFLVVRAIAVSLAAMTASCIIVPTGTSVSGSIESSKLESLVGSKKAQVLTKVGMPTYLLVSPKMRESYYLYDYDISNHSFRGGLIPNAATFLWPVGGNVTRKGGKLCYLIAFDTNQNMVRYEIKDARQSDNPVETNADKSWLDEPSADCQEYIWDSKELSEMLDVDLTTNVEGLAPLRMLAMEGDPAAAIALTWGTGDITSLKALALNGETHAASGLYDELSRDSQTIVEAWRYLCVAANKGDGKAQEKMGFWYRTTVKRYPNISELQQIAEETDIYPDNRIAYMWYTLSDANGNPDALRIRAYTVRDMTPEEIGQAEQMVRDWKPGDCPSAEHRLGPPGLQSRAEQDDAKTAIEIASLMGTPTLLKSQTEGGNTNAAFVIYLQLSSERRTTSDAWKWLCMIANSGHGEAQRTLGNWHRTLTWQSGTERLEWLRDEVGIQPDNRIAYMWYTLAGANGNLSALSQRKVFLEAGMTPEEIGQAEQMVRDWKPGDCPSAEHRLGMPGETGAIRALAENGDRGAAILIARYAKEFGPLNSLAEKGDYEAAHVLAAEFDDYSYLRTLGKEGDPTVAFEQYLNFRNRGEPSEFSAAWNWLCLAANAGYSKAQAEVGFWHRSSSWGGWNEDGLELLRKVGVRPDNRTAYMWYTLAVSTGGESTRHARDYYVAELVTDVEIFQAEQMAKDWKPGDCPSAEHRLSVPGET